MNDKQLDDLRYGVEKSIRYHQRRRGWLETWHRIIMFAIIISGSSALLDVVRPWISVEVASLSAAVLGAFDLVTGISVSARDYAILQGKFASLLAEMTRVAAPTDEQIREWSARRIEIEAEEPSIYWVVEADCDNEIARMRGNYKATVPIPFWRYYTMHLFHQDGFVGPRPEIA
jgi:hypothetical protein